MAFVKNEVQGAVEIITIDLSLIHIWRTGR